MHVAVVVHANIDAASGGASCAASIGLPSGASTSTEPCELPAWAHPAAADERECE